jgi:predicted esterase
MEIKAIISQRHRQKLLWLLVLVTLTWQTAFAQSEREFLDVRYGERRAELTEADADQDRLLDIRLPQSEQPSQGYPVIMFIHGGGFSSGDKGMQGGVRGMFQAFMNKGYAIVSINYRLLRKRSTQNVVANGMRRVSRRAGEEGTDRTFSADINAATDEAAVDATLALEWLNANGADYGLDLSRLFLWGGSAGSITALYAAFVTAPSQPAIRAIINCWGGIRDTSLIQKDIPVLTIHGDQDETVNVKYGRAVQERMEQLGSTLSRIIIMKGLGHAQYKYVGETLMPDIFLFLDDVLSTTNDETSVIPLRVNAHKSTSSYSLHGYPSAGNHGVCIEDGKKHIMRKL